MFEDIFIHKYMEQGMINGTLGIIRIIFSQSPGITKDKFQGRNKVSLLPAALLL